MYKIGYICTPDTESSFENSIEGSYLYPTLNEVLKEKDCYPENYRVAKVRIYLDKIIENGEYLLDS